MEARDLFDEQTAEKTRESTSSYTRTLNITMQDQDLNQYVLKIKDPLTELTRTQVVNAFSSILGQGASGKRILYSRANVPFTEIGQIQLVEVTTEKQDIV